MRVVSLVPSLTEAVAVTAPGCSSAPPTGAATRPASTSTRIGGTKNPDVDRDRRARARPGRRQRGGEPRARPRRAARGGHRGAGHRDPRRDAGLRRTGAGARGAAAAPATRLARRGARRRGRRRAAGRPRAARSSRSGGGPGWCWAATPSPGTCWPGSASTTCTRTHAERYPASRSTSCDAAAPELVVLPDEPYRFTADDGPEAFAGVPAALVSGRHLTWYGPSLAEAPARWARRCEQRSADQAAHAYGRRPPPRR